MRFIILELCSVQKYILIKPYRNQSNDLGSKPIDWFLHEMSLYWKVFANRLYS